MKFEPTYKTVTNRGCVIWITGLSGAGKTTLATEIGDNLKNIGIPNILIDDRPVNIERWRAAGGHGILYQANRDPLTTVEKGLEDYAKIRRNQ